MRGRRLGQLFVYESTLGEARRLVLPAAEIVVVRSGSVSVPPADEAAAGDVLLMPAASAIHGPADGRPARATHFQLSPALAERVRDFLPPAAEVIRAGRLGDAVPRMMFEKRGVDACSALAVEAAVCQLLALARRIRASRGPLEGRASREVAAALEYARKHLEQAITLEDLARAAGMSVRGLSQRFAAELGTSPLACVRELRLREAQRLLRHSPLGIAEVALRCGFYDHAHLTRTFRAHLGSTPADYRRSLRKETP